MFIHDDLIKQLVDLLYQEVNWIASVLYWWATDDVWCEFISIYFESNRNYFLRIGNHGNSQMGGWNWLQELVVAAKGIGTSKQYAGKEI